jgi:small subunit ribosomal protein S16
MGRKKRPFYRIVVADSKSRRDGYFIDVLGYYNPLTVPAEVKIDEEKALKWLNVGALPTDTTRNLFTKQGIMKKFVESKAVAE